MIATTHRVGRSLTRLAVAALLATPLVAGAASAEPRIPGEPERPRARGRWGLHDGHPRAARDSRGAPGRCGRILRTRLARARQRGVPLSGRRDTRPLLAFPGNCAFVSPPLRPNLGPSHDSQLRRGVPLVHPRDDRLASRASRVGALNARFMPVPGRRARRAGASRPHRARSRGCRPSSCRCAATRGSSRTVADPRPTRPTR